LLLPFVLRKKSSFIYGKCMQCSKVYHFPTSYISYAFAEKKEKYVKYYMLYGMFVIKHIHLQYFFVFVQIKNSFYAYPEELNVNDTSFMLFRKHNVFAIFYVIILLSMFELQCRIFMLTYFLQ
jgi:hypothetical protein